MPQSKVKLVSINPSNHHYLFTYYIYIIYYIVLYIVIYIIIYLIIYIYIIYIYKYCIHPYPFISRAQPLWPLCGPRGTTSILADSMAMRWKLEDRFLTFPFYIHSIIQMVPEKNIIYPWYIHIIPVWPNFTWDYTFYKRGDLVLVTGKRAVTVDIADVPILELVYDKTYRKSHIKCENPWFPIDFFRKPIQSIKSATNDTSGFYPKLRDGRFRNIMGDTTTDTKPWG